ncbi:protein kinase domain containing protein [Acanthamoeba castellanii str. Neff]|uniref:Protein kinase domain containing protein n=1 Tax=Acanthamoeba castellanii (strain ATCC 30010 / Neff) TaxID=1257118 RepID=L8GGI6_ACACF|nr:protein kinase domain containing protein [Acanthamoeba castellanii str. Neff]ELR11863.1 protein kinase domain containing protein [Acanthamoeba castellanii str. Neff]
MQRVPATPRKDSVKATISQNDLSFVNKLGVGAFGDVWEGRLRGTTTVAIKSVRSTDKTSFLAEAQIMSYASLKPRSTKRFALILITHTFELLGVFRRHPNVVTFFGLAEGPGQLFIITEFMADGSLDKHLIRNQGAVSVESLIQMTKDLAAGMDHLAEHGIIHRDLAARNLLLEIKRSDVYRVKVCDFGLSRLSTEELNPQQMKTIPVRWTAVEVFMGKPYTGKCDVWSFGVTVWEIFSFGALPYAGMATREVVDAVLQGVRLAKPDGCPDDIFTQIILPCLQANPEDRPTFRELYHKLESLFPSQQRTSSSLTTSPTTSNFSATLSHSSSCGGSGGISLSSSPAAAVPTSMAMQVAEEVMASSQSLTALAPYASSSGVTTRSPPSVESAEPSVTPVAPSKTEDGGGREWQDDRVQLRGE